MTILIQAANISHAYGGNQIFRDAHFEIRQGDRVALFGTNGAGKSTLLQIAAKTLKPDAGVVTYHRGLTVGYLSQESSLDSATTVRDVIALAAGDPAALDAHLRALEARMAEPLDDDALADVMDEHSATLARLEAGPADGAATGEPAGASILAGLRLPASQWDLPVGRLSGGEKKLVALARLLLAEPNVLLLDEPDNHLDLIAKAWLEAHLAAHQGAVALITHDRLLIDRAANAIFELEDGQITVYPANYTRYLALKQARLERAAQLRDLEEREFKKLKASAEQLTQWARQNPKFAPRAENQRRKLAEERERLARTPPPILNRRRIAVDFAAERGSTLVLEATGLAKSYGTREVLAPFDLTLRHGEVVGLTGPNGSGKSTLFKLILGQEQPTSGTLRIGPSIRIGYYAQEQETLDPAQTPLALVRARKALTEQAALSFLNGLLFERNDALHPIGNLSGGERARLQIGVLILDGANFLLLDEPTNNLDIPSIEVLEAALRDFTGTILAISHDRYFLDTLCDRTLAIEAGRVHDYPGGYTDYQTKHAASASRAINDRDPARGAAAAAMRR